MVFLVVIFVLKTRAERFKNSTALQSLAYDGATVNDVVSQDTDGDGVPDWEENLQGTDPTKRDTNGDGIPDGSQAQGSNGGLNATEDENLTQTDKFSRELFATVATLSQTGQIDQDAVDKITDSLAEQIKNPVVRKTYLISDLKTTQDNSKQAVQKYKDGLVSIYAKYPAKANVIDVLSEFLGDGENVNASALVKLDPIIKQVQGIISARVKLDTPSELAQLHLNVINAFERLVENLNDIKLYDTDPIVAMGAMSKYQDNENSLQLSFDALANAVGVKLNN